ncbi:unnamed protein product [Peniophora sp. CBMAI 1063]|nr:unnamed protein product [Peniophora sp. CBMAI 1063]
MTTRSAEVTAFLQRLEQNALASQSTHPFTPSARAQLKQWESQLISLQVDYDAYAELLLQHSQKAKYAPEDTSVELRLVISGNMRDCEMQQHLIDTNQCTILWQYNMLARDDPKWPSGSRGKRR